MKRADENEKEIMVSLDDIEFKGSSEDEEDESTEYYYHTYTCYQDAKLVRRLERAGPARKITMACCTHYSDTIWTSKIFGEPLSFSLRHQWSYFSREFTCFDYLADDIVIDFRNDFKKHADKYYFYSDKNCVAFCLKWYSPCTFKKNPLEKQILQVLL